MFATTIMMNIKEANMKIGKLRQVNGFWNNLTFTGNMCRMRSALTNYLSEEGLKSRIEDGLVLFEFDDNHFCASFCMDEGYPECEITYEVEDEEYESLSLQDKTYISDRVNTDMENHCIVYTFNDSIKVTTSFYFTGKKMMLKLFSKHFQEITESLDLTLHITKSKIKNHNERKSRKIGFTMDNYVQSEDNIESVQIAAKA